MILREFHSHRVLCWLFDPRDVDLGQLKLGYRWKVVQVGVVKGAGRMTRVFRRDDVDWLRLWPVG